MSQNPTLLARIRKRIELRTKFPTPARKRAAAEAQRIEEDQQAYERGYPDRSK